MHKSLMFAFALFLFCFNNAAYSQHSLTLRIQGGHENEPASAATVVLEGLNKTAIADSNGIVTFTDVPAGTFVITITHAELHEKKISVIVPGETVEVALEEGEEHEEEEEVIINSTRTSRTIDNIPTRVETISGEELNEKSNMKPGDIRMLLSESTGIQTQQTSATSYNSSIRIQGLDGRYTQILRDGFPLYGGFSGGLSLMQVAPLDLKQIEVIKGSSSTLYGGGAIAGLVNLITKTPQKDRELSFLANATSAGGLDLSGFYSQLFGKTGTTVFASRNSSSAYDPAKIGFTAIPEFERYTINPRLFFYGSKLTADIGVSFITENRTGGSMGYIKNGTPGYYEKNNTDRLTGQVHLNYAFTGSSRLELKQSYSTFDRTIEAPSYIFAGRQHSAFTELVYALNKTKSDWVFGLNNYYDDFEEVPYVDVRRDYKYNIFGGFIQHTWTPNTSFSLESGVRVDESNVYEGRFLPRIAAMYKATSKLTLRASAGTGYKTPTIFNEESERLQFRDVLPIQTFGTRNETSTGVSLDVNYRSNLGAVNFSINQLFFYTRINDALALVPAMGRYAFINQASDIDSKGMETNLKFIYGDLKLFIGYTYTDVTIQSEVRQWQPLSARHRLNNVLMYEKHEKFKFGLEAYYFSKQKRNDGSIGRSFWTFGFMAEKIWNKFSVFINFENFTDTRQTRFENIYTGSTDNPVFKDIYAPVDGFVVNGGLKVRL